MSDFAIVEKPALKGTKGRWNAIAAALQADRTKAVFVAANGANTQSLRVTASTCLRRKFPKGTVLHTHASPEGITIWIDEEEKL